MTFLKIIIINLLILLPYGLNCKNILIISPNAYPTFKDQFNYSSDRFSKESGAFVVVEILKFLTNFEDSVINLNDIYIDDFFLKLNNKIYHGNIPFGLECSRILKNNNFKIIYVHRDLRDVAVINSININRVTNNWIEHRILASLDFLISWKLDEIIRLNYYYQCWLNEKNCYSINFEKLIGATGFTTKDEQINEIRLLASYIGLEINDELADNCIKMLIEKSLLDKESTFEAKIWPTFFNNENKELFKKLGGQLLINLGYEKDFNW